ncbi:7-carboxy-7-deazaguanine synthase [Tistrella bauzanensis]|uniref:7-carboxy-7-deazaguanine synthase n=1 Tax=Tistrella bauzanensis TaxID=657419 RepID=A0ABQ1J2U1_9PROT|nr:7-carboxy-7-deazaguanine synthase [Tistrella bauzanensis]GGB56588.1 7-carboxy-7-deazaguanine synthase [Tistrella bauzanensis]
MSYTVKELFLTLQGEGAQAGRAAVFCRFAGCNLWSGREVDRADAICRFCDTDFVGSDGGGGGRFATPERLAAAIAACWGNGRRHRYVVFTGGEPLLQLDPALIAAVKALDFEIAVETNGTIAAPDGIDWICVSPKAGTRLVQRRGQELKLVFPQAGLMPDDLDDIAPGGIALGDIDFVHRWVQPMDGPAQTRNTEAAVAWCLAHPDWRLSLQTHKLIGIA